MRKKNHVVTTNFSYETEKLGQEFADSLKPGDVVCLYGDLGSGKTTFVKGLAYGLGIQSGIISPTFVLIRQHGIKLPPSSRLRRASKTQNLKVKSLYHIDLYRLDDEDSIKGIGLEELFGDTTSIVVIEWAEKLGNLLPKKRWDVRFKHEDENSRKIHINHREG